MKHSAWATSTVAATIPIAMLVGIYMTHLRPGRLVEGSVTRRRPRDARGVRRPLRRRLANRSLFRDGSAIAVRLDHRLRISRVGPADLAAARAARLPLRVHQDWNDHRARARHRRDASARSDAAADAVHQRPRPGLRRQGVSVRVHHSGLWSHLGLPFADCVGHDAQDARARTRRAIDRLRRDADGIVRRRDGDDCGRDAPAGRVFRDQQSGRRSRHGSRRGRKNQLVGIRRHRRAHAGARRRRRRDVACMRAPAARRRWRSGWRTSSPARSAAKR